MNPCAPALEQPQHRDELVLLPNRRLRCPYVETVMTDLSSAKSDTSLLVGGLSFTEAPRWRDNRLWFSDCHVGRVLSINEAGSDRVEAVMPGPCSGIGWRSDGTLLVLLTQARQLVAYANGQVDPVADLTSTMPGPGTEMIADRRGRAYIGNAGFDFRQAEQPRSTHLIMVDENGKPSIVADDLEFPNGTVITPDEKMLIIAETRAGRLSAFSLSEDGLLSNRRTFAELGDVMPDGICLDQEGAVWVASPNTKQVVRVSPAGKIVLRVSTGDRGAYACMLGGADRKTLYVATGSVFEFGKTHPKLPGGIEAVKVSVPGAGVP